MWAGCSILYTLMFAPAYYSAQGATGTPVIAGSAAEPLSKAALVFSAASLLWESAADLVQQLYYEKGGQSPCRAGPWAIDRQANYHVSQRYRNAQLMSSPSPRAQGLAPVQGPDTS